MTTNGRSFEVPPRVKGLGFMRMVSDQRFEREDLPLVREVARQLRLAREDCGLEGRDFRVLVAFSGGEDSSVLLDIALRLAGSEGFSVVAAHFDHGLRPESGADAEFVRQTLEDYGIPFLIEIAPPWDGSENLEAWARGHRYDFLERARSRLGADMIATAHHERDLAETVLQRLVSGRLATDATGIAPLDRARRLIRPLLGVSKEKVHAHFARYGLMCREDSSNRDLRRMRNRVRETLLPQLAAEYNPSVEAVLAEAAERFRRDDLALRDAARAAAAEFLKLSRPETVGRFLAAQSEALRWRIVRELAMVQLGTAGMRIGFRHADELARKLSSAPRRAFEFELGAGLAASFDPRLGIRFIAKAGASANEPQTHAPVSVPIPGVVTWSTGGAQLRISARMIDVVAEPEHECLSERPHWPRPDRVLFDARLLNAGTLSVRARQNGEVIDVWKRGRRPVKKLLQEAGVPAAFRGYFPIVESDGRILWLPGAARSTFAPIGKDTVQVLELVSAAEQVCVFPSLGDL